MVEQGTKGPKVFVSRNTRDLVTRLLELHIPELSDGVVEIMGLARDAGDRTKIAVYSHLSQVDPIGACVGENGARIKEVVDAFVSKFALYPVGTQVKLSNGEVGIIASNEHNNLRPVIRLLNEKLNYPLIDLSDNKAYLNVTILGIE